MNVTRIYLSFRQRCESKRNADAEKEKEIPYDAFIAFDRSFHLYINAFHAVSSTSACFYSQEK